MSDGAAAGLFIGCVVYVCVGFFLAATVVYDFASDRDLDPMDRLATIVLAGTFWLPAGMAVAFIYAPARFVYRRLAARRRARMPRAVVVAQRGGES